MERRFNIIQGEYMVGDAEDVVISTLLGSCVAACIFDPLARVGGMNHFLLPGDSSGGLLSDRYGVHLMELLVNGLLKKGAARDRLTAKLFGGARAIEALGDIGDANSRFARDFLSREGIAYAGGSLGAKVGRRLQFWPASGRARQSLMAKFEEPPPPARVPAADTSGELELF